MKLDDAIGQQNRAWVDIAEANQGLSVFASWTHNGVTIAGSLAPSYQFAKRAPGFGRTGDRPEQRADGGPNEKMDCFAFSTVFFESGIESSSRRL